MRLSGFSLSGTAAHYLDETITRLLLEERWNKQVEPLKILETEIEEGNVTRENVLNSMNKLDYSSERIFLFP